MLPTPARLLLPALLFGLSASGGDTWPRFRGLNGDGRSDEKGLPAAPADQDLAWKVSLPGAGHGSPAVWKDRIYLCAGDDNTGERFVVCLKENDGALLWKKTWPGTVYPHHKFNGYGSGTPAADEHGCVVYWASDAEITVLALTPSGEELWKRTLGAFDSDHGSGTSPAIVDGLVFINNDQRGKSSLVALDRKTGADRWSIPRESDAKGTCYPLPARVEEPGQRPQLVLPSRAHGFTGIDPESGRVLWEISDAFAHRVVACPVLAGDLVIGTAGEGGGGKRLVAVRPGSADGARKPQVKYEITRAIPYVPTPLVVDGLLFVAVDGTGLGACFDAATGEPKWQERLGSGFFGSPVVANGVIYLLDKNGDLITYRAGTAYEPLGRYPLGEIAYSTPAIASGRLYCRTLTHLHAFGRKP